MRFVPKKHLNSIGLKILLAYVIEMILSVGLIALVLVIALALQNNILSENDINDFSGELAEALQFNETGMPVQMADEEYLWLFESLYNEVAFRVLDQSGKVALASTAAPQFWSAVDGRNLPLTAGTFEFLQHGIIMDAATALRVHQGQNWYLQVAVSRRFMFFAHTTFALRFAGDGLLLLALVQFFVFAVCAHFTLIYTLRPLRKLSESAALISPRSMQARLKEDDVPTEIAPLVQSFNVALERLEQGYRLQQEFLATAAHELKTPLALIRAQLELMPENEERNWLLSDVTYMARQVQQLLLLTEASEVQNYQFSTIALSKVASEALAYLQRMADAATVTLTLSDHSNAAIWQADHSALFTLLKNLLENAIQHAPRGSEVRLTLYPAYLSVRDVGPGVPPEHLPQLFQRFWRGAHRRDIGAGLGLAICQEIALAHGWSLTAALSEPGLVFIVALEGESLLTGYR
ncbi:two-component sensor histidine kinase [Rheinheimera riviphila]|uniref:histidine kinase n=1 Tax=Rheinheimera riviphila TaxID=1834037 RepID=A0A437QG32_9GAMM|nr:ATP-binding protein [Rheinheimera riviphila]RVU33505.1 two-component sensor histidine kinase [Rheinheimera riviphila]